MTIRGIRIDSIAPTADRLRWTPAMPPRLSVTRVVSGEILRA